MSADQYREYREEGDEWKPEEEQSPDSLIFQKSGEHVCGHEHFTQDFAAWDFEHRDCQLDFQPLFLLIPEHGRIPKYVGMRIVCHAHQQAFLKRQ